MAQTKPLNSRAIAAAATWGFLRAGPSKCLKRACKRHCACHEVSVTALGKPSWRFCKCGLIRAGSR